VRISGQVTGARDGRPLANVQVNVTEPGTNGPTTSQAVTDKEGRYEIVGLPSASLYVTAHRVGFQSGVHKTAETPPLNTNIDFALEQSPRVVGTVVDSRNRPVTGAVVFHIRKSAIAGVTEWFREEPIFTDDLGRFERVVTPGKYILGVSKADLWAYPVEINESGAVGTSADVTTFYPEASGPAAAQAIEFPAGADVRLTLKLKHVQTTTLRGRVLRGEGIGREPLAVMLSSSLLWGNASMRAAVHADGAFEIRGVPPGSFRIQALLRGVLPDRPVSARQAVTVGNRAVSGISIQARAPVSVFGSVVLAAGAEGGNAPRSVLVGLYLTDPASPASIVLGIPAEVGGKFDFSDMPPDRLRFEVDPYPGEYYVRSARSGVVDLLDAPLDLSRGPPEPIEIVLDNHGPRIRGVVSDRQGKPVALPTVLFLPESLTRRTTVRGVNSIRGDEQGAFEWPHAIPGRYIVLAWKGPLGNFSDPDFLDRAIPAGQHVTIVESRPATLQLQSVEPPR